MQWKPSCWLDRLKIVGVKVVHEVVCQSIANKTATGSGIMQAVCAACKLCSIQSHYSVGTVTVHPKTTQRAYILFSAVVMELPTTLQTHTDTSEKAQVGMALHCPLPGWHAV